MRQVVSWMVTDPRLYVMCAEIGTFDTCRADIVGFMSMATDEAVIKICLCFLIPFVFILIRTSLSYPRADKINGQKVW